MQKSTRYPTDVSGKLWENTVWTHDGMDGTEGSQLRGVIGINLSEKERKKVRTGEVPRRGGSRVGWSWGPCGRPWGQGTPRLRSRASRGTAGGHKDPQPRIHITPAPTRYSNHVVRLIRIGFPKG